MLIRTQNRTALVVLEKADRICMYRRRKDRKYCSVDDPKGKGCITIETPTEMLGEYSSKEKALKVLDMIQEEYIAFSDIYRFIPPKVFQMPADEEVETDGN